jgi:hypothetical protein
VGIPKPPSFFLQVYVAVLITAFGLTATVLYHERKPYWSMAAFVITALWWPFFLLGRKHSRKRGETDAGAKGTGESMVPPHKEGTRYPCPCCGYPTLSGRGIYEICDLCNWEDDGQEDPRADEVWGGPNGSYSLTEARENFRRYGVMYGPAKGDTRVGGSDFPREKEAKLAMRRAFDALQTEADPARIRSLQRTVEQAQEILSEENQRRADEYEKGR